MTTHGFAKPAGVSEQDYGKFSAEYQTVVRRRAERWRQEWDEMEHMMTETEQDCSNRPFKLKRFLRKGIPPEHRPKVWLRVSGAQQQMQKHPDLFNKLVAQSEKDKSAVDAIQLDLDRTFPDNKYFRDTTGQLHRHELDLVLRAVAARYPSIGYCQGLNYTAALCLIVTESAEQAFWLMDANLKYVKDYYRQDMAGLKMEMFVLTELLKERSKATYASMVANDTDLLLTCSKWFLCWYLDSLPIESVLRIWDCLFFEGPKILVRVALTLILQNKESIRKSKNFMESTSAIRNACVNAKALDAHHFMEAVFTVPGHLTTEHITELRQQYIDQMESQEKAQLLQSESSVQQKMSRSTDIPRRQLDKIIVNKQSRHTEV